MTAPTIPLTRPVALALRKSRDTLPPDVRRLVEAELALPPSPDAPQIDPGGWPRPECCDDAPACDRSLGRWTVGFALAGALIIGLTAWWAYPARGHEAPTGWAYDPACCSDYDCAPIPARSVTLTPTGWRVQVAPGEHRFAPAGGLDDVVPFGDPRIRRSGDGGWHVCISPVTGRLLCVYEPERLG
jgi:hypothetical protein